MKRFFADAILICILVGIGSYIKGSDTSKTQELLEDKIGDFEDDVAQHKVVKAKVDKVNLHDIEDNGASSFAKQSSEFIVDTIHSSVGLVSEIFQGILK